MPKIIWESEDQRTLEWAIAKEILANATDGTKVQRTNQKIPIDYTDPSSPNGPKIHLNHSFIKVGDKILVLAGRGLYLGIGGYAGVKLAEDETGQIYALKIQHRRYNPNEDIAADLYGVSYGHTERDDGHLGIRKHYSCYKYLGIPLRKYLSENQLSVDKQLTLALKLVEAVELYHHKTGKAHLDLKPDNICIDNTSTILKCPPSFRQKGTSIKKLFLPLKIPPQEQNLLALDEVVRDYNDECILQSSPPTREYHQIRII
ncbi:Protein kinase domain protein [Piscirickettsia salmonis]|nr:Protein kinase domain protein [Piscirickettsia salmonis]QGP60230.1 Protein kinase domain protein [Piscirickettsia salmonis]QGP63451.1 Protein kinase domain protein [Piscirickettsia salmonis]